MTNRNYNLPDGVTDADIDKHFDDYYEFAEDAERERIAEELSDRDRDYEATRREQWHTQG